ncbi:guanine nucleotide-binding protein-like 3-like protein [Ornithorhynchus anatinus]|uniref:Guanine nucleotide-binding protein-like 3-like protein n=1 Tax=Ornithorhynchus anatinus TaxID=9258 RepID=F7CGH5_ORNAN|nr:guanine nucleotide-binding protein-like 3-like protein [Ornithorhynchus anatinus]XP_028923723.1 guanine nucleotide-binding protein-like 3-like protein [Ornithorhynchus anatinus]
MTKRKSKNPRKGRNKNPDAKQRGKKDPGVPQIFHFKEHAKKSAEMKKKRVEEMREKQRVAREKEKNKRRSLESFQQDALKRQRQFEQKEMDLKNLEKLVQLENENSRKAYYREFKKVVEAADVILEVLDARDPQGCRCPQVEQAVVQAGTNKKLVLVLNKIDLVSKAIVEKWLKYLRNEFPTIAFKASTQQQNKNLQRSKVPVKQASAELLSSGACIGADCLMKVLGNYCRNQDIKTAITVGVVGFPNVGKSSLINSLKRARACSVGATPGVTKCLQEVHLDKHIKLLDCPGIVMTTSTSDAAMILRNCIKIEQLVDPVGPVEAILRRCNKEQIIQHYRISDFKTTTEFLALLARRLGKLKKGGTPDHEKAAKSVLTDWTSGKISYFTHPPETHTLPIHISAEIVTEMGKAFDFEALEQGNLEALAVMPSGPSGIGMQTSGFTSGIEEVMEEEELSEEGSGEEEEAMDDDRDPELGDITVEIKSNRSEKAEVARVVPRAPNLQDIQALDPLLQGQGLLAASKKRKKLQKRADKIATKLSDTLVAAMDFTFADD